jgi:hypothetical protein
MKTYPASVSKTFNDLVGTVLSIKDVEAKAKAEGFEYVRTPQCGEHISQEEHPGRLNADIDANRVITRFWIG